MIYRYRFWLKIYFLLKSFFYYLGCDYWYVVYGLVLKEEINLFIFLIIVFIIVLILKFDIVISDFNKML